MKDNNIFDLRLPAEMAKVAEQAGLYKVSKKRILAFFSDYGWYFYFYRIYVLYHGYDRRRSRKFTH